MSVPVYVLVLVLVLGCSGSPSVPPDPAYPNLRPHYSVSGHLLAFTTNNLSDTLSVVDLDTMTLLGNAPIGRDPIDIDGPTGLAIDRARGIVYVALSYPAVGHTGHGAAPRAGYLQALALSDLRPLGELRLDVAPSDLALSDDGATLAIAHHDLARADTITDDLEARRATVALVAPAPAVSAGGAVAREVTVCVAPYAVAFGRTPARLFVACTGEDSLAVVDGEAGAVIARLPAGDDTGVGKPYALSADRTRGQLLLSARASHQVVLYGMDDGDAPARRFTATLPGVPYFAAWLPDDPSGARLVVPTQGPSGAVVVDGGTGALVRAVSYEDAVCLAPRQAAVSADGRLFLLCEGDRSGAGALVQLDPETLAAVARVEVGTAPDRMRVLEP